MKTEKKEYLMHKQIYEQTVKRNKKIGMANLLIFGVGLILNYLGMPEIGSHFLWLAIVILIYTIGSNLLAKHEMQKYRAK